MINPPFSIWLGEEVFQRATPFISRFDGSRVPNLQFSSSRERKEMCVRDRTETEGRETNRKNVSLECAYVEYDSSSRAVTIISTCTGTCVQVKAKLALEFICILRAFECRFDDDDDATRPKATGPLQKLFVLAFRYNSVFRFEFFFFLLKKVTLQLPDFFCFVKSTYYICLPFSNVMRGNFYLI